MVSGSRMYIAGGATIGLFLVVQLGALALVDPFIDAGYQAVENPSDPINSIVYLVAILVATGSILAVIKLEITWLLRGIITLVTGLLAFYVFSVLIPNVIDIRGIHVLAWGAAGVLAGLVYGYPEWYVIDGAGVIIAAGAAGLFGISFGPLPAILLLGVLAIYDAVSVYQTKHMLTLAESVTDLKLPLLFVIPLSVSYSFLTDGSDSGEDAEEGRDAFYIGLGDTVMPTVMVASAAFFVSAPSLGVPGIALNFPALTAMVGTLLGLVVLLMMVAKGRPHAGLPLLNGGAIIGYLIGAIIVGIPLTEAIGITPYI